MISRKHPIANWILVNPSEHRYALNKVLDLRDQASDQTSSGLPPEAITWFWDQELPRLIQRPEVRVFAEERISELTATAADLRKRIQRQTQAMQEQAEAAEAEAQRLTAALEAVS